MKLLISSNFTADFLARFLDKKLPCEVVNADYNQYAQLILDEHSEVYRGGFDVVILFLDFAVLYRSMTMRDLKAHIEALVSSFIEKNRGLSLVINNVFLPRDVTTFQETRSVRKSKQDQMELNSFISSVVPCKSPISIFDLVSVYEENGYFNLVDNAVRIFSDNPYNKKGLDLISTSLAHFVSPFFMPRKKCLVLDFDNTLWGGIAGEDGLDVKIGGDREGQVFLEFQCEILKLKSKGVLLASCSKNNESDARLIFEQHENMVLKWDDFVVHKVNWESKDENIRAIAKELNVAEDSMVFVDDSPSERALVNSQTRAVVPNFPQDLDFRRFVCLVDDEFFYSKFATEEDSGKSKQYAEIFSRNEAQKQYSNIDEFINSLEIHIGARINNRADVDRAFQMSQKTNQFNFTTVRYSQRQMADLFESDEHDVFTFTVSDRFGDHGLTALLIIFRGVDSWKIDTFLMSCRVLGKKIEFAIISWFIRTHYRDVPLYATYIETDRNSQLASKYEDLGFSLISQCGLEKQYKFSSLVEQSVEIEVKNE